jgi:hypothetical protein
MRFEGYHSDTALPMKRGQKVVIPAGVTVRTMHPSRDEYVTKRAQTVTIDHILPGQSVSNYIAYGDKDYYRPLVEKGFDFSEIERLREANDPEYYKGMVAISNPSVSWAGAGGYWCRVDINDILAANNITEQLAA